MDYGEDSRAAVNALRRAAPRGTSYIVDAVAAAGSDVRAAMRPGDRTVVVVVAGHGPEASYSQTLPRSKRPRADLYLAVQFTAGGAEASANLARVLERLTQDSGGAFVQVLSSQALAAVLERFSHILIAGYRLSYRSVPHLKQRRLAISVQLAKASVLSPTVPDAVP
jgi:hypothetical protein